MAATERGPPNVSILFVAASIAKDFNRSTVFGCGHTSLIILSSPNIFSDISSILKPGENMLPWPLYHESHHSPVRPVLPAVPRRLFLCLRELDLHRRIAVRQLADRKSLRFVVGETKVVFAAEKCRLGRFKRLDGLVDFGDCLVELALRQTVVPAETQVSSSFCFCCCMINSFQFVAARSVIAPYQREKLVQFGKLTSHIAPFFKV